MGLFPIQFLVKISQLNNKKLCYLTFLCNYLFLYIWKHIYFPVHLFVGWLCNSKGKNDLSVVMIPWSLKRQLPVLWQASMENNFHAIFLASPERLRTDSILYIYIGKILDFPIYMHTYMYSCSGFCLFINMSGKNKIYIYMKCIVVRIETEFFFFLVRKVNNLLRDMVEFLLLEVLSSKMMAF